MVRYHTIAVAAAVGTGWLAAATLSEAQQTPTTGSLPLFQIPTVMISAGLGTANDPRGASSSNVKPMQMVSVQFLPTRHLVVEAEFGRWEATWDHRVAYRPRGEANGEQVQAGALEGWSGGINLLYRTEPRRVSAFVGGGPFFGSERYADSFRLEGCVPAIRDECWRPNQYEYRETSLRFQAVTGADVELAGPLRAYASVQFTTMDHAYLRWSGGVRVVAASRSVVPKGATREQALARAVPSAERQGGLRGRQVRVTFADGLRTQMRFVSIDAAGLTAERRGQNELYSLDRIAKVETVHHTARRAAIIGAIAGFLGGYLGSCGGGDEQDCWPEIGALFAGIGAGSGALIGAAYDSATASRHVIYTGKPASGARLTPVLRHGGGGVGLAIGF